MSIIPEHTSKVLGETQLVLRHLLVHSLFYVDFVFKSCLVRKYWPTPKESNGQG